MNPLCKPLVPIAALAVLLSACTEHDANPSQTAVTAARAAEPAADPAPASPATCGNLPGASQLKPWMKQASAKGEVGGLAGGAFEWAAVVDRDGRLCAIVAEPDDPSAAWPGSQSIAKAKAYTANAFSTDTMPMSTARLYTMNQPGRTLYGTAAAETFNPKCMNPADQPGGIGLVCGGAIAFGGGLPLYDGKTKVGGLGLSGDTPCADHEMAKRVRTLAGMDPPGGPDKDDITYSSADGPSLFTHPLCPNTMRNGKKIGDAPPAQGY